MSPKRWLQFLLIAFGGASAVAVVPMLMPWRWMVAVHEGLGMGPLEHQPVVEYLARGMSGLCAFYGGLLLLLATDVLRYQRLIAYQTRAVLVLSTAAVPFSYHAGMPIWWVVGEVVTCWLFCCWMLVLLSRIKGDTDVVSRGAV